MPFDAWTCEIHQARISRTCGVETVWQGVRLRRALTYSVAAVARGPHRLIGSRGWVMPSGAADDIRAVQF